MRLYWIPWRSLARTNKFCFAAIAARPSNAFGNIERAWFAMSNISRPAVLFVFPYQILV